MRECEQNIPIETGHDAGVFEVGDIEAEAENVSKVDEDYYFAGMSSDKIYRREINMIPMLSADEEETVLRSAMDGDPEAKERLINANLRLSLRIAGRFVGRGLDFADLVQAGNEGLIYAANRFDKAKADKFSTFATHCIRGYINRTIDEQANTIRVPVHVSQDYRNIRNAYQSMTQELGSEPTVEELAAKLDMDPKAVKKTIASRNLTLPIDNNIGQDGEAPTFAEITPDKSMPVDEQALINSDVELLIDTVNRLPERERTVIELRYLIGQNAIGANRSEKEVGDMIGVSKDVVGGVSKKAISTIKSKMGKKLSASY